MPIPNFVSNLKTSITHLPPAKMITLLVLVAGTIAGLIFIFLWAGRVDYQILYTNLAQEDAGAIVTQLREKRIPYQISGNGSSILAPRDQIYETRMGLAAEGLPQGGGIGFEIFDNTRLGMTEFVQNVNFQRALQGELSRTINRFSEVESSRVHIVLKQESLFIEKEKPATASVVVKLRSGKQLSRNQVQGIVHLVSSSVSGLQPDNVTVVDHYGEILAGVKDQTRLGQVRSDQLEFKEKMENRLENSVKTMLENALGPAKAIVRLSCSIDFRRSEKTEERFYPDNRVIRSEQLLNEVSTSPEADPEKAKPAEENLGKEEKTAKPVNAPPGYQKQDRTVNYEIGKITSHTVEPIGRIERISVAVLVDGTYTVVGGKDGVKQTQYVPRTDDEMKKLENIVKRAVNFDADRGDQVEVANIPFQNAKVPGEEEAEIGQGWLSKTRSYLPAMLKYLLSGVFVLFTFLFVIRPLIQWVTSTTISDAELLQQLPKTVGEIEREYGQTPTPLPFMDRAAQMIRRDAGASAELMKDWLKET